MRIKSYVSLQIQPDIYLKFVLRSKNQTLVLICLNITLYEALIDSKNVAILSSKSGRNMLAGVKPWVVGI